MRDFKTGQRWICDVNLQLGLGTVQTVEHRTVNIYFGLVKEMRSYAKYSAPLTRIIFKVGDNISSHDGTMLRITHVGHQEGLIFYSGINELGEQIELFEEQLSSHVRLSRPTERLFTGQFDQDKWFRLRYQTLLIQYKVAEMPLYGLIGARTRLIPHQLYIAHEVANRYAPRILLADEVGLGKTIEAGLILHQQLLTERIRRVLIIVPEALIHQWLIEMMRRFNLQFSIFDEARCQAQEENDDSENPFYSEQLVICSLNFLRDYPKRFESVLEGNWDLLVVDEAHHLHWSQQGVSPEYAMIKQLAARIQGVLLLTATPEQLGKASHFARLSLLDPDRFSSLEDFIAEEQSYEPIAKAVEALLEDHKLSGEIERIITSKIDSVQSSELLAQLEGEKVNEKQAQQARKTLAELLLDRHGTGRILFRNTRTIVRGFPERKLIAIPLLLPVEYQQCLENFETAKLSKPQLLLSPELLYQVSAEPEDQYWTDIDPRIDWLSATLNRLKPKKILVITASAQSAIDIALAIKRLTGKHIPVFHENMSLIERDRAAAFFADKEAGSQLLVCSEIGSEGRNFQFSHHLVLFDLPLNPDLLEQRIGRLDRIGQTETIHIHVPYLKSSALEIMVHWYQEGLNAFEKICPAAQAVFLKVEEALIVALHQCPADVESVSNLIYTTKSANKAINDALERGRNKLLEYSSFRPTVGKKLYEEACSYDVDSKLPHYMETIFDSYGVHIEEHREDSYLIESSGYMPIPFPGLKDDGLVITYSRTVALANEDIYFLTWEHPMVVHAMDMILSSELGNAVVATLKHEKIKPGILLLESIFVLETSGQSIRGNNRYLPPVAIRIFMDEHGNSNGYVNLDHEAVNRYLAPVSSLIAKQVIELKESSIKVLLEMSEQLANVQVPEIALQARNKIEQSFTLEIERLKALQKINPNVRKEEIQFLEQQLEKLTVTLNMSNLRLDSVRVIVAT